MVMTMIAPPFEPCSRARRLQILDTKKQAFSGRELEILWRTIMASFRQGCAPNTMAFLNMRLKRIQGLPGLLNRPAMLREKLPLPLVPACGAVEKHSNARAG